MESQFLLKTILFLHLFVRPDIEWVPEIKAQTRRFRNQIKQQHGKWRDFM